MENPIKMDDLGVPLFLATPVSSNMNYIKVRNLWIHPLQANAQKLLEASKRCKSFHSFFPQKQPYGFQPRHHSCLVVVRLLYHQRLHRFKAPNLRRPTGPQNFTQSNHGILFKGILAAPPKLPPPEIRA